MARGSQRYYYMLPRIIYQSMSMCHFAVVTAVRQNMHPGVHRNTTVCSCPCKYRRREHIQEHAQPSGCAVRLCLQPEEPTCTLLLLLLALICMLSVTLLLMLIQKLLTDLDLLLLLLVFIGLQLIVLLPLGNICLSPNPTTIPMTQQRCYSTQHIIT